VTRGEVALFIGVLPELVAMAVPSRDGRWALDIPVTNNGVLVGRAFAPAVGIAIRAVTPNDQQVEIDVDGPCVDIAVDIRSPGGELHPAELEIFLDPVRDAGQRAIFNRVAEDAERPHFATIAAAEPCTRLRVQAGTWQMGAAVVYEHSLFPSPDTKSYIAARANAFGMDLPGDPWSGFRVSAESATTVVLQLRELTDDELS
jgi:hypothetical protein